MPRSRSRSRRNGPRRRPRPALGRDSLVLLDLLDLFEEVGDEEGDEGETMTQLVLLDAFGRASWSFHAGPDAWYFDPGSPSRHLARFRAREWFLFEFTLPSGETPAEEWLLERDGQPGSAAERRAIGRFLASECGVFDVEEVRADGWLRLAPVLGGAKVLARPIDRATEMLPPHVAVPAFAQGDTIVTRLYRLDAERAEMSAGADRIGPEVKELLLSDPPGAAALRSGLVVESLFGADAGRLLAAAGDAAFPGLMDDLLDLLSDGSFDYERLWRELDGEADPVAVARQLLAELDEQTAVEQEMVACGVVGAWLRRRQASAGAAITPETVVLERHLLEQHVRTILDVPGDLELRLPAGARALAMAPEDRAHLAGLPVEPVQWVVDLRRDDRASLGSIRLSAEPYPRICAVVEQESEAFGIPGEPGEAGEDQETGRLDERDAAGDEPDDEAEADDLDLDDLDLDDLDEEELADLEGEGTEDLGDLSDEPGATLVEEAAVGEGEDEAEVALEVLVDALRGREEGQGRPERVLFRQRRVAALLGETLREVGLGVGLRYFSEAVDVAMLGDDLTDGEEGTELAEEPEAEGEAAGHETRKLSSEEQRAAQRLAQAAQRALGLGEEETPREWEAPVLVTPAHPLEFHFVTLEGERRQLQSFAVVPVPQSEGRDVQVLFLPPSAGDPPDFRGREGEGVLDYTDRVTIETADTEDVAKKNLAHLRATGWPCGDAAMCTVAVRRRLDAPPVLLSGAVLDIVAAVVEAAGALLSQLDDDTPWQEARSIELRVEPLGEVTVTWRSPWPVLR